MLNPDATWNMDKISYLNTEEWRQVAGYDFLYEVSNYGRIRGYVNRDSSIQGKKIGNIKRPTLNKAGYLTIMLWKGNFPRCVKVHRLVAEAFIPNPENKRTVNHKNGIKTDNSLPNLEWATHKENHKHAVENGLYPESKTGEDYHSSKLTNQDVIEIRILNENGFRHETIGRVFNIHINTVSLVVTRKIWNHV